MPEAAVHEDGGAGRGEDEVRPPRQPSAAGPPLEAEAQAKGVQGAAQAQLGPRVPALDRRHDAGALFGREDVGHAARLAAPRRRVKRGALPETPA
jgi:hypothetical protein